MNDIGEHRVFQNLALFRLPPGSRGRSAIVVQLWWLVAATLFRTSPQVLYGWRRWLLRCFGARVGRGVLLRPSVEITYPWNVSIGEHSWIGDDVVLYSVGEIRIGAHSVISQRSYLCTASHEPESVTFDSFVHPITIGAECWVASDVFVAPGVTIADAAVVGARSTVIEDLPGATICYGNPARPVRPRGRGVNTPSAPPAPTLRR